MGHFERRALKAMHGTDKDGLLNVQPARKTNVFNVHLQLQWQLGLLCSREYGCNCVNCLLWDSLVHSCETAAKNETHPPTPPALPLHPKKKKKNQQQQKVCYEGMLGLQVIVDDSQNRAWRRTKSIVWRKKQSKTKPPPFLCRITRLPSLARTPRNLVQLPC